MLLFTETISADSAEFVSMDVEEVVQNPVSSDSSTRDTVRAGSGEAERAVQAGKCYTITPCYVI